MKMYKIINKLKKANSARYSKTKLLWFSRILPVKVLTGLVTGCYETGLGLDL